MEPQAAMGSDSLSGAAVGVRGGVGACGDPRDSAAAAVPSLVCGPGHSELSLVTFQWSGIPGNRKQMQNAQDVRVSVRSYSSSLAFTGPHVEPFNTAPSLSTVSSVSQFALGSSTLIRAVVTKLWEQSSKPVSVDSVSRECAMTFQPCWFVFPTPLAGALGCSGCLGCHALCLAQTPCWSTSPGGWAKGSSCPAVWVHLWDTSVQSVSGTGGCSALSSL